jgi:hypothetical protein
MPGTTQQRFLYNLSRAEYEKSWGTQYQRPGFGARLLAFALRVMPRIGPLKAAGFRVPAPEAEQLFMKSFNETISRCRGMLVEQRNGTLKLPNENFDIGEPPRAGTYKLADHAYAELLDHHAKRDFADVSPQLRQDILTYYEESDSPSKKTTARELHQLQTRPPL